MTENLVDSLQNLQLANSGQAQQIKNSTTKEASKRKKSTNMSQSKPFDQWPKWTGDQSDFATFLISLDGIISNEDNKVRIGSAMTFCYGVFTNSLPPEARKRLAPYMKERKLDQEWNMENFVNHLEELFIDKDAPNKAQTALNAIKQGPRQTFAKFRDAFEQLCAEADALAPTGPSKIVAMKNALNPTLRTGLAYRSGMSRVSYDLFVMELQDLANELESLPEFQLRRGSDKESYTRNDILPIAHPVIDQNTHTQNSIPENSNRIDRDGDVQMTDITILQSQMQSVMAALNSTNPAAIQNNKFRLNEKRPFPPDVSQTERDRRINSGICERCCKSPSHRWSDCKFRNFQQNPTPRGYTNLRRGAANSVVSYAAAQNSPDSISGNE